MSIVLACDLGGSSFRAALVDADGQSRAEHAAPAPATHDQGDASEIDPLDWWASLMAAASALARAEPRAFAEIAGIAICGVTRTQIFLNAHGSPLRKAISWKDIRSGPAADALKARLDDRHPEHGAINAFHPLARLAWLRKEEPAAFASLSCVLEPKDFLNAMLTGRRASDPVSSARLAACKPDAAGNDPLALLGLDSTILPALREPCEIVGRVRPGLPDPLSALVGVPVFCSSHDTWAAVVGLGAMRNGHAYNISGTTEVLGVVGAEPATAEGLMSVDWRGLFQLGGPSQTGADSVTWLLSLLGQSDGRGVGRSIEALLAGARDPQPLLFLPYLQGERVPYWNPDLRGAFIGLNRRHGATDLAYAVLEGIACLNRIVLARAEDATGRPVQDIRLGGGAAANAIWCAIKADLCRRPVLVGAAREPGVLGAALIAWTGLGRFPSLAHAQAALVRVAARYEPDPARAAAYDRLFALFQQSEAALAPVSQGLVPLAAVASALPGMAGAARAAALDPAQPEG